ncbi:flavin reductase family protein [Cereibacter sp. SYSU M97828]|nr:flavin reductase family protein [Cereibacter flavus]
MTLDEAFRTAFRLHPAGVSVLAADDGEGPVGLTITSLISVTSSPPTVGFSLSSMSSSSPHVLKAGTLVIHLLRQQDQWLGELCSTKGADRFGPGVAWERLPTGEPRYTAVGTWFRARIVGTLDVNGSTLVAAELLEGAVEGDGPELSTMVYMDRRWHGVAPA